MSNNCFLTEKKHRLPASGDDWSQVNSVIHACVSEWLGRPKLFTEIVQRDGDASLLPTSDEHYNHETGEYKEPSTWSEEDEFWELMDGCTGNTIATYISGMGLCSEKIGDVLQDKVQDAITDLFLKLNSIKDEEDINLEYNSVSDDLREMAYDMLNDMSNYTLKSVLRETKGEG